ncbi:hypothetical protein, partial [Pectobacterium brasiliense]|uniref:hypothetical protein n=1 Tax=Pectobacterium brasiliense TaxID=180957 RepID=UPI001968E167
ELDLALSRSIQQYFFVAYMSPSQDERLALKGIHQQSLQLQLFKLRTVLQKNFRGRKNGGLCH